MGSAQLHLYCGRLLCVIILLAVSIRHDLWMGVLLSLAP